MFERNREREAGSAVIEHEFGSASVREQLKLTSTKDVYLVEKLEVVLSSGESYDLIANELPENTTMLADFRDEPLYDTPAVERGRDQDSHSTIWYPRVFSRSIPKEVDGGELRLQKEENERFTSVGDIAAILHEIGHVIEDRKMDRKKRGQKDLYGLIGEPLDTPEDVRKFIVHVLRNEVDSWVEAFRRERELRRSGIVIEPDIENNKQRIDIAMESVATYAHRLFREKKNNISGAGTAESERIFLEQWHAMLDGEGRELRKSILAQLRAYPK